MIPEYGIHGIRLPVLAKRLGINHSLILYHFGSIETLRQKVCEINHWEKKQ